MKKAMNSKVINALYKIAADAGQVDQALSETNAPTKSAYNAADETENNISKYEKWLNDPNRKVKKFPTFSPRFSGSRIGRTPMRGVRASFNVGFGDTFWNSAKRAREKQAEEFLAKNKITRDMPEYPIVYDYLIERGGTNWHSYNRGETNNVSWYPINNLPENSRINKELVETQGNIMANNSRWANNIVTG